jgi:nucleotide-binding universal stress UspA family protein
MTEARPSAEARRARPASNPSRRGPVILATEGAPDSGSAAIVAAAIAARLGRPLRVVSVLEPDLMYAGYLEPVPMPTVPEPERREAREAGVRRYIAGALPDLPEWTLDVRYGSTVHEIAAAARDADASILVIGAAPHQRRRGIVSGVRAAQVLRHARCPVLSVAPSPRGLPARAVAAIDFSPASVRAARDALLVLGDAGTLTLLHVALPFHLDRPLHDASGAVYGANATALLERIREQLLPWAPPGATIETQVTSGDATEEILGCVDELRADLVVAGTHGPSAFERIFIGSVTSNLLHAAPCTVLASPQPSPAERFDLDAAEWGTGSTTDAAAWPAVLDAFTVRNSGRRVRVEVDDPAIGAQVQASGFTLAGATYDVHDRRVDVMLGAPAGARSHLTRGIGDVTALAVARDATGRDTALQIRHGAGETLVVFTGG